MKNVFFPVFIVSVLVVGCGNISSQPPQASVKIGSQYIQTVVNGYQWSDGNHTTIADVAFDPAKDLKKYDASVGSNATLSFDKTPKIVQLTMWSNGTQVYKRNLSGTSFALEAQPGDYTYEITGNWGKDYVNYDFEVQVK